jgi:hypothetical protein
MSNDFPSRGNPTQPPPGYYQALGQQPPPAPPGYYQPPTPGQQPPPAPQRGSYQPPTPGGRRPPRTGSRHSGLKVVGLIAGGLVLLFIGVAIGAAGKTTTGATRTVTKTVTVPGPTVTKTTRPPKPTAVPGPATSFGAGGTSGVYIVGQDIRRGTYHTTGATGGNSGDCYIATLSGTNTSDVNDIIDNDNVTGPDTITVGGNVKAVQVSGCNVWTREG